MVIYANCGKMSIVKMLKILNIAFYLDLTKKYFKEKIYLVFRGANIKNIWLMNISMLNLNYYISKLLL